jgi:hypothetical protein
MRLKSLMPSNLLALCLIASLPVYAALPDTLKGDAYALDSDTLLYHEFHTFEFKDGDLVGDQVEYALPDGTVIGRKTLDFRPSLFVPAFETSLYDGRFVEGLRYEDGEIVVYQKKGENADEKSKVISGKDAMAADAGFNSYVFSRFDDLLRGDDVKFYFVAASQLAAVKFKATRVEDRDIEGVPVVEFNVAINSFLSLFIDPLQLSYDEDTRNLIEYRGLSNIRDEDGDLYKVRIRYPQFLQKPVAVK